MIAERMGFTKIIDVLILCGATKTNNSKNTPTTSTTTTDKSEKKKEAIIANQGLFGSFSKSKTQEPIDQEGVNLVQASMETGIMILPDAAYLGFQNQLIAVIRPETLKDTDEAGSTVLMKAAYAGHYVLVKDLWDLGCDPDAMDKSGNTALVWAVLGGRAQVVQGLYENGAHIDGAVPYCKKLGIQIKGQMTPLMAAAYCGHLGIAKFLIKEKCNINLRCGSGTGKSALMVAACSRRIDIVRLLDRKSVV